MVKTNMRQPTIIHAPAPVRALRTVMELPEEERPKASWRAVMWAEMGASAAYQERRQARRNAATCVPHVEAYEAEYDAWRELAATMRGMHAAVSWGTEDYAAP